MKARIVPPAPPAALAWNPPEGGALEAACAAAGLRFCRVEEKDLGRTVADLCGLPGAGAPLAGAPAADSTPALVLWGLDRRGLDAFLQALRDADLRIPLKAMVTATNRGWAFGRLLEELHAEHRAVRGSGQEGASV